MEERALRETESLEVQRGDLERRLQALEDRERNLAQQSEELKRAKRVQRRELERISGLSASQAKQLLLADVEQEARHQAGLRLQEIEAETKHEAERRARNILSVAMQRLAGRHASDSTTRLVELPSDEMKISSHPLDGPGFIGCGFVGWHSGQIFRGATFFLRGYNHQCKCDGPLVERHTWFEWSTDSGICPSATPRMVPGSLDVGLWGGTRDK